MDIEKLIAALKARKHTFALEDGDSTVVRKFGTAKFMGVGEDARPKSKEEELAGFDLPYVVSTPTPDHEGDIIRPEGGEFRAFRDAGAPVLYNHNPDVIPVARAPRTMAEDGKVKSVAEFPSAELNKFGNDVGRMVLHGYGLSGASIGFIPAEWKFLEEGASFAIDFVKWVLKEWSITPVPCNPEAFQGAKSLGIDWGPFLDHYEKALDASGKYLILPRSILEDAYKAAKAADGKGGSIYLRVDEDGAVKAVNDMECELCDLGHKAIDGNHVIGKSRQVIECAKAQDKNADLDDPDEEGDDEPAETADDAATEGEPEGGQGGDKGDAEAQQASEGKGEGDDPAPEDTPEGDTEGGDGDAGLDFTAEDLAGIAGEVLDDQLGEAFGFVPSS